MTTGRLTQEELDRVLRRALEDDLSREVEQALQERLPDAWRRAVRGKAAAAPRPSWLQLRLALRPALLGAASIVMLVAGGTLRLGESSSFLADAVEGRQVSSLVNRRLSRVSQMNCRVTVDDRRGRSTSYSIRWNHSGYCRVEIESPDGPAVRTVTLDEERPAALSLLNARDTPRSPSARETDPVLLPVRSFLSPARVAGLLDGRWHRLKAQEPGRPDEAAWGVTSPAAQGRLLVKTSRDLPLAIDLPAGDFTAGQKQPRPGVTARFQWEKAEIAWGSVGK